MSHFNCSCKLSSHTGSSKATAKTSPLTPKKDKQESTLITHTNLTQGIPQGPSVTPSPAKALMRERSNRRAELFSLSHSSSQRLLTVSWYCCWMSMWSYSAATVVILTSHLLAFSLITLPHGRLPLKPCKNGRKENVLYRDTNSISITQIQTL